MQVTRPGLEESIAVLSTQSNILPLASTKFLLPSKIAFALGVVVGVNCMPFECASAAGLLLLLALKGCIASIPVLFAALALLAKLVLAAGDVPCAITVSYTHLDVYKRQS